MSPRKKAKSPRNHYMITDFTPDEKSQVFDHCGKKNISISKFLAGVALEQVRRGGKQRPKAEEVTITLRIPPEQKAKLEMFAHRQDKTPDQFVQDLAMPTLEKGKTSFTSETESLRYYLSPEEHRRIKKYLKERNLSARTYVAFLALKAMRERDKK
jgi:predicted DNA-binding protein